MDRKPKVNSRSDKSTNGGNNAKEEALEKLRQMEWARNKQDSWHLSRPNHRNDFSREKKKYNEENYFEPTPKTDVLREKKKYDEDNYYDGTAAGNQKLKRNRKPRETLVTPKVPEGFSLTSPGGPPPVNAWSQKKGSALFEKPPDELDFEEDEMIRLALEESLKTAELDKLRHLERMRLYGAKDLSTGGDSNEREMEGGFDEQEDEEKEEEDNNYLSPPEFSKVSSKEADLHFIDKSSAEDLNSSFSQKRRLPSVFQRRKPLSPEESGPNIEVINKGYLHVKSPKEDCHPSQQKFKHNDFELEPSRLIDNPSKNNSHQADSNPNRVHDKKQDDKPVLNPSQQELNDNMFEPSRPVENLSLASNQYNFHRVASKPTRAHDKASSMVEFNKPIVIPKKGDHSVDDHLSDNFNSTLTFGDTKGLLDDLLLEGCHYESQSAAQNYPIDSSAYEPKETDHASYPSNCKAPSSRDLPSETDILIHTFIRHEMPSSLAPNISFQETERPAELFSLNASQQYFSPNSVQENEEQNTLNSIGQSQPISIDKSVQSSNSSVANSPLQNNSPLESADKHFATNPAGVLHMQPQSVPFHPLGLINVQNHGIANKLQEPQLAGHLASHVPYTNYSPGFLTHAAHPGLHLNAAVPTVSPYHLPNSNLMMPHSFSSQDLLNPQIAHYYQQQLMLQQTLQAQHAAMSMNDLENSELSHKVQQSSAFCQFQSPQQQFQQAQSAALSVNDLENSESHHKLQQSNFFRTLQPQLQQSQRCASTSTNGSENSETVRNEQTSTVFSQIQPQLIKNMNQPPMITTENQTQLLAQNLSQYQQQLVNLQKQQILNQQLAKPDGSLGRYQQTNIAEQQVFQPIARSQEEIIFQCQKAEQMLIHWRQQLAETQAQTTSVPHQFLIPTQPMEIGSNNYYAQSVQGMHQCQPLPVEPVSNTGQPSPPNQQDTSGAPRLLNLIPDTDTEISFQPKIGRGRGRLM